MTVRKYIRIFNDRTASAFLVLLLCSDLLFIVLHFANALTPLFKNPLLNIEQDRGYPEMYQYLKYCWMIAMLFFIAWKHRSLCYVAWGAVFTYFLVDDALMLHERIGRRIAENFSFTPPLGLRLQDFGELMVSATAGILLLTSVILVYRGGSQIFRKVSQDITLLIFILAFFGVIVDMAHVAINLGGKVTFFLGVIEDGGEMLSVSLLAWYTLLLKVRRGDMGGFYLCDLVRIVLTRRYT